jgi:hypothetical protein
VTYFGWNLFLVSKNRLLSDPPDLVNSLHLLLCCVNLIIQQVPSDMLKISLQPSTPFSTVSQSMSSLATAAISTNTLAHLCQLSNANYDDVQNMENAHFLPFIKLVFIYL